MWKGTLDSNCRKKLTWGAYGAVVAFENRQRALLIVRRVCISWVTILCLQSILLEFRGCSLIPGFCYVHWGVGIALNTINSIATFREPKEK